MDESRTSAQQIIGARIRELREAAGISQTELARRVYVSRQTVGNWEAGRTLADAQSLVLLAQVFETTVDDLIGEKGSRAVRSTAEDRHALARLLASAGTLLALGLLLVMAAYLLTPLRGSSPGADALRIALLVIALACELALSFRALPRLRSFMRNHDLENAIAAAAYLEGRDPAEPPPGDFLFRWFIPYWKAWLVALAAAAFLAAALYLGALA